MLSLALYKITTKCTLCKSYLKAEVSFKTESFVIQRYRLISCVIEFYSEGILKFLLIVNLLANTPNLCQPIAWNLVLDIFLSRQTGNEME